MNGCLLLFFAPFMNGYLLVFFVLFCIIWVIIKVRVFWFISIHKTTFTRMQINGPDIEKFDGVPYAREWLKKNHHKTSDMVRARDGDKPEASEEDTNEVQLMSADTEDQIYRRTYLPKPLLF